MEIEYRFIPPSKDQYHALFETTGWNRRYQASPEDLARALANSQFVVAAYHSETLVGFGRILTDGVLHAMIYEMIVHPDYQRQGIGTQILHLLIRWCNDAHIYDIQLFCASGKRPFYEKNGFVSRPDDAPGMHYSRQ